MSQRLESERDGAPDHQQRPAVGGRLEEAVLSDVRQVAAGSRAGVRLRGQLQPPQQPHLERRRRTRVVVQHLAIAVR